MRLRSVAASPRIAIALAFLIVAATLQLSAQANPNQVALLQWYFASTTSTFSTQTGPWGIVYDGANIWVLNSQSYSLSKYRPSDGALLTTFALGQPVYRMAYDGTNLWLVNATNGNILKLRPTDGAILATTTVAGAGGIVFDGGSMWVAGSGNTVTDLAISSMAVLKTVNVSCPVTELAYEWVTLYGVCPTTNQLMQLRVNNTTASLVTVGLSPSGLTWDGANMWVANQGSGTVTKVQGTNLAVLGTYTVGSSPMSVEFDGANVWVANTGSNTLTKLRASDGANLGSVSTPSWPVRLAFDGAHIWASHFNANSVGKY